MTGIDLKVERADVNHAVRRDPRRCVLSRALNRRPGFRRAHVSGAEATVFAGRRVLVYPLSKRACDAADAFDDGADFAPGTYRLDAPRIAYPMGERS